MGKVVNSGEGLGLICFRWNCTINMNYRHCVCNTVLFEFVFSSGKKKIEAERDFEEDLSEIPVGGLLPFPIHAGKC